MQISYKFNIMRKDQCISITDLRTRTNKCLEDLKQNPKYIFANNKLVGVLVDPDEYDKQEKMGVLYPLDLTKESPGYIEQLEKLAEKATEMKVEELVDL